MTAATRMTADEILRVRERLGWTMTRMARELGVSRFSVYKWELGLARPHPVFEARLRELEAAQP